MNKKISNKRNSRPPLSPQQFMREKARTLPVGRCYINPDWKKSGLARAIVTRQRPGGNLVTASFTIDPLCRGVIEAVCRISVSPDEFAGSIASTDNPASPVETTYNEIHNLIYGSIEFAREAGLNPAAGFALARFALEDDTDRIPLIEHEFGINGRHTLIMRPPENYDAIIKTLRYHLGNEFDTIDPAVHSDPDPTDDECHPSEPYSYTPPTYPRRLQVRNRFISDALLRKGNFTGLSDRTIRRILSVDAPELASDIAGIILFEIGRTRNEIENAVLDDTDEATLIHALLFLSQIDCPQATEAILEIMRQSNTFLEFHLADSAHLLVSALCAAAKSDPAPIEKFLYERRRLSHQRNLAAKALVSIAAAVPRRRRTIIAIFRRLLKSLPDRLPQTDGCDADFAGFLIDAIVGLHATELLPDVETLFATGFVNRSICGSLQNVAEKLTTPLKSTKKSDSRQDMPDIFEFNHQLKQLCKQT